MGDRSVFMSSDGRYFGAAQLWARFESGAWTPCCWDDETGREWVETRDGELLMLIPISNHALPDGATLEHGVDGARVHARRELAVE